MCWTATRFSDSSLGICLWDVYWRVSNMFLTVNVYWLLISLLANEDQSYHQASTIRFLFLYRPRQIFPDVILCSEDILRTTRLYIYIYIYIWGVFSHALSLSLSLSRYLSIYLYNIYIYIYIYIYIFVYGVWCVFMGGVLHALTRLLSLFLSLSLYIYKCVCVCVCVCVRACVRVCMCSVYV